MYMWSCIVYKNFLFDMVRMFVQIIFSNNFYMLFQSLKLVFSIFMWLSFNLNFVMEVEFVMRSLLFNDMYKFSEGDYEMMYEDVDMEFWL